jgi:hypothetical protein
MHRDRIIKINEMIGKIKNKDILKEIFYLAQPELQESSEYCNYTHNINGIFFDLRLLSDSTLEKIEEIVKNNITTTTDTETLNYSVYCSDDDINVSKLNNIEKNIMLKKTK